MRYVGDGTEIPGLPPRDLTAEEAAQWGAIIAEVDGARVRGGMGRLYEVMDNVQWAMDDSGPALTEIDLAAKPLPPQTLAPAASAGVMPPRRKGQARRDAAGSFDSAGLTPAGSAQDDSDQEQDDSVQERRDDG